MESDYFDDYDDDVFSFGLADENKVSGFAKQLIVIVSSKANQNSGDTNEGGDFTLAFTAAYSKLAKNDDATFETFFKTTLRDGDYLQQTPQFLVSPKELCGERLNSADISISNSSAVSGGASSGLHNCLK